MDGNSVISWADSVDELHYWVSTAENIRWLDNITAMCKAELERRKGILDELAEEAQELNLGY